MKKIAHAAEPPGPAGELAPPAVWFAYSPNRRDEHPQGYLRSFTGIFQADAVGGYDGWYADRNILEAAFWGHAQRKLFELHKAQASPIAAKTLKRIAALSVIEAEVCGQLQDHRRKFARRKPDRCSMT